MKFGLDNDQIRHDLKTHFAVFPNCILHADFEGWIWKARGILKNLMTRAQMKEFLTSTGYYWSTLDVKETSNNYSDVIRLKTFATKSNKKDVKFCLLFFAV